MGLMIPAPQQAAWQHNLPSTPSLSLLGTRITGSASLNTKGPYSTLIASCDFEVYGITLQPSNSSVTAAVRNRLFDLAIGAAASEVVIASNISLSGDQVVGTSKPNGLFLPIRVTKGSRLSMRSQGSSASNVTDINIFVHGGGDFPQWAYYTGVETLGADPATSKHQAHTAGNSGTFSAWANLGSPSSRDYKAILPVIQQGSDTTMTSDCGYLEIGVNSIAANRWLFMPWQIESIPPVMPGIPLLRKFPSGTQFMVRATMSTTADADFGVGLMGFY